MTERLVTCLPDRFLWSSLHHMDTAAGASAGPPALFLLRSLTRRHRATPAARAAVTRLVGSVGADALRRLPELVALLTAADVEMLEEQRPVVWTDTAHALLDHVEKVRDAADRGECLSGRYSIMLVLTLHIYHTFVFLLVFLLT